MLKFVLAFTGLLLAALGAPDLYRDVHAGQQSTLTCDQFARHRPSSVWLRLTGCELDYVGVGFRESGGRIVELIFPVRPAGRPRTEPAALVVATRDPRALALAQGTIGAGRQPDQEQFLVMMLRIVTTLGAAREVEGLARTGILQRVRARRLLSGLSSSVAPGAVLMDLHARPRALAPAVLAGAGVAMLLIATALALRQRTARGAAAAAPPAEASVPRLRVLLLAIPADAGADAIEHAPPLGDAGSVRATIEGHIAGLRFDGDNRGRLDDKDGTIAIDLGPNETVHTAVVDARGDRAAGQLHRLLARTGWRAYAPKSGEFVEAAQPYSAGTSIANR